MGVALASDVMKTDSVRGPYKAVLLVLAIRADDETGGIRASQATLAIAAGVSVSTVNRALNYFEVARVIGRSPQRAPDGSRSADQLVLAPEHLAFIDAPPSNSVADSLQRIADALDRT